MMLINGYSVQELGGETEYPSEVYNTEESRVLDMVADAMLYLAALGDKSEAKSADAKDFASLIDDLVEAKSEVEYDSILSCYGGLGQSEAVQAFVRLRAQQLFG